MPSKQHNNNQNFHVKAEKDTLNNEEFARFLNILNQPPADIQPLISLFSKPSLIPLQTKQVADK